VPSGLIENGPSGVFNVHVGPVNKVLTIGKCSVSRLAVILERQQMLLRAFLGVSAAVLAQTLILDDKAEAADRYAMTCVENKTSITLNYKVRWGNGAWKASSVAPGRRISHWYEYPAGQVGRSPPLFISFDDDLSGQVKQREYRLESYRSPQTTDCIRYGREYQFRYDGSAKRFIDLISIR
jgi:hypothetical protein